MKKKTSNTHPVLPANFNEPQRCAAEGFRDCVFLKSEQVDESENLSWYELGYGYCLGAGLETEDAWAVANFLYSGPGLFWLDYQGERK